MSGINTYTALGKANGIYYVFVDLKGSRQRLKNEKLSDEHPFLKFANSRNLPELLSSLDEIFDTVVYEHLDFLSNLMGPSKPDAVIEEDAEEIASLFEGRPTRTTIEKTEEAIRVWDIDNMAPSDDANLNMKHGNPQLWTCTELKDIIRAKNDLRRTCLLMAWLIGKTDFDTAHGLTRGDKNARMDIIDTEAETNLGRYYKKLSENTGNTFAGINIHACVDTMHLYRPRDIELTIRSYVEAAFTLLLSDETKKMNMILQPYTSNNNVLSTMWSFFADHLSQDEGPGSISVCKRCGKFFSQQRSTKQFCSDSCRVMALRSQDEPPELEETQTMQMRKAILGRR